MCHFVPVTVLKLTQMYHLTIPNLVAASIFDGGKQTMCIALVDAGNPQSQL